MMPASETAYQKIRAFILQGDAVPGMQLTEEKLAEISGVSRTPVRDAVRRLENEMLVIRSASKRLSVADWSAGEVDEMFTLRAMLEAHAAARAAQRIDSKALGALRAQNDKLKIAIGKSPPDIAAFLQANRQFHELILKCAQSPRLSKIMPALVEQPVVRRTAHQYSQTQLNQSAVDHDELIAAFAAKDVAWARSVMTSHIRRAFHSFSESAVPETEN
ncbi:MAG: GntR family transcriptional regulator [Parasphingorhabdus sp.]|uniref:GntR family transcriptional regulator n=1 Tax=Parasphingorhabdus sp. TaxID=2709688 RepID=UPI00329967D3